jgi:hypothetical protein
MADLVRQYADCPLGIADASVISVAERLGATHVAMINHRHFLAVRPAHCAAFELLPALGPAAGQKPATGQGTNLVR